MQVKKQEMLTREGPFGNGLVRIEKTLDDKSRNTKIYDPKTKKVIFQAEWIGKDEGNGYPIPYHNGDKKEGEAGYIDSFGRKIKSPRPYDWAYYFDEQGIGTVKIGSRCALVTCEDKEIKEISPFIFSDAITSKGFISILLQGLHGNVQKDYNGRFILNIRIKFSKEEKNKTKNVEAFSRKRENMYAIWEDGIPITPYIFSSCIQRGKKFAVTATFEGITFKGKYDLRDPEFLKLYL